MNLDIVLGAAIALVSGLAMSLVQHLLALRLDEIQRKRKREDDLGIQLPEKPRLRDIMELLSAEIDPVTGRLKTPGALRGEFDADQPTNLLPRTISKLKVNTQKMQEKLNSADESVSLDQLVHCALDILSDDTD